MADGGGFCVPGSHDPRQNRLLAALPEKEYAQMLPQLELVQLPLGYVIYEPGVQIRHAYFPTTLLVSLLYVMRNGATAEFALVGNEGVTGVPLLMGGETATNWAIVQNAGYAYQINGRLLQDAFYRAGPMQHLLLGYINARLTHIAQTALCNRYHSLDQHLSRWLLMCLDRIASSELTMTHELIANNLGVRRESVTDAARKLQRDGLIEYRHGHIMVLDRAGLEAKACECYSVIRNAYDRLLGG